MDFVTAISTGATVKYTTEEYAFKFMETVAHNPHNWLGQLSHHFVGQCFRVVGLKFTVSVEAFEHSYDYPYRDDNLTYVFNAVPFVLQGVESFLKQLPTLLAYYGSEVLKDMPTTRLGKQFYELTQPVPCYLHVVNAWAHVVRSITDNWQREDNGIEKFLTEPLARLSFSILAGLVKLLPNSGDHMLKEVCLNLAVLARYGIFYEETFDYMLTPMLDMFEEHFQLFCEKSALKFVYTSFICEMSNSAGYIKLYKFLEKMLDKFGDGQQRDSNGNLYLRLFTNELITDNYLAIQFETLKRSSTNPLLLATLQYLQSLQRHLVSTEVFPTRFLEQILLVLLNGSSSTIVCSLAAQLYVTLARRQYDEQEIVVHIIETFLKTQHNSRRCASYEQAISLLEYYLLELMAHFPALKNYDYYMYVLNASHVRDELVLFTAHSMYALFGIYTKQYSGEEVARQEIHKLLNHWPRLIERTAQRLSARAVLYGIYFDIDFQALVHHNGELLCQLETFCLSIFLTDQTLTESEFSSLFSSICKSIKATGNENLLVITAQNLQDEYTEISMQLLTHEQEQSQSTSGDVFQSYAHCVRRLFALLKENKMRGHQVCNMYETLAVQLLEPGNITQFLALYGYESLALMLILIQRERDQLEEAEIHEARILQLAQKLRDVCVSGLRSISDNLPQVKSMFCAILVLELGLHHCLPLNAITYDVLLNQLSNPALADKARTNTLFCSYVQEMHLLFRQLHSRVRMALPSNRIWKPLLQFKTLTKLPDYISPELGKLIPVLIKCHIETYAHCLPVIHLHICNESMSKKRVEIAQAAHLQLIEEHASAKEAWLLKLHVFNVSLELLVKNLAVRPMETSASRQRNHLLPLQHLMQLLSTLRLEKSHFNNIARLLYSLKATAIGDQDKQELDKFLTQISTHKYRCEDEHVKELTADELSSSELKAQPPGPLTLWQAEAFSKITDDFSGPSDIPIYSDIM
ncbi:uncharacterized protein LOC117787112 [Drosophila innubila]|uniref:uncharacterized protein LOC117787112 n=1 Tax=Drosophila innubila TaxID=198719 RepID=UPI00148DDA5D|nr:uncharacterized protein LOC117787112 [Drosophila innubila]